MLFRQSIWLLIGLTLLSSSACLAEDTTLVKMEAGLQQTYTHPKPIKRASVGDRQIVGITLIANNSLLLTAKKPGYTTITIWESRKSPKPNRIVQVQVSAPVTAAQQQVQGVAPNLQAEAAGGAVEIKGKAASLEEHALGQQAAAEQKQPIDATKTSFDNQVQIDIKIVEVSQQNLKRAGLFLGKNQANTTIAVGSPGALGGVESGGSSSGGLGAKDGAGFTLRSSSGFLPVSNAFNFILGSATNGLLGALSVLESNGFAYTLAEPSLTAISGQNATFLAGGEFPVPIRTGSGIDSATTILYKEYGVRLTLTPTVLDPSRIFLKVSPEVSELDFNNTVQTGGVAVPGLRVRRTDTSVSLGDGESFVISGLVSRNTIKDVDKFPGLGDLPVIGAFFRSTRFDREDKELLMVVTPHLVRPLTKTAKLPALPGSNVQNYNPSFSELFFQTGSGPALPYVGMSK